MAEGVIVPGGAESREQEPSVLCAAIVGLAVGGPILGVMGFALLPTAALLLVASPLLLLFSPIIVPAGLAVAGAMAGFGVAAALGLVGVRALAWAVRSLGGMVPAGGLGRLLGRAEEGRGMDVGEYLEKKGQAYEPQIWMNRLY